VKPDSRSPSLSAADRAALHVLVACQLATDQALQGLARATLDSPRPEKPRQPRSYRLINVTRGGDGEMIGDVEYSDGRVRRFRASRDEASDLVGEFNDGAPDATSAPAVEAEPAPEGNFADVFGTIEGARDD
jgi:hypothetical protein